MATAATPAISLLWLVLALCEASGCLCLRGNGGIGIIAPAFRAVLRADQVRRVIVDFDP